MVHCIKYHLSRHCVSVLLANLSLMLCQVALVIPFRVEGGSPVRTKQWWQRCGDAGVVVKKESEVEGVVQLEMAGGTGRGAGRR
jgi:hypothetical protein